MASEKITAIIEELKVLTVLELSELVHAVEEEFGVSAAAAVAVVLSHTMAKKVTEPLAKLDLEHPSENDTYEELSPLLIKIYNQHKQIKEQVETLRQKSDEFDQIISSMNEGLVLLDEHGMVLSMNMNRFINIMCSMQESRILRIL